MLLRKPEQGRRRRRRCRNNGRATIMMAASCLAAAAAVASGRISLADSLTALGVCIGELANQSANKLAIS